MQAPETKDTTKPKARRKIQIDLTPNTFARLESLKEKMEASSYTEVTRESYKLLEYLVDEMEKGARFYISHGDEEPKELKLFIAP